MKTGNCYGRHLYNHLFINYTTSNEETLPQNYYKILSKNVFFGL